MKRMRLAINGFGRIGRNFFRLAFGHPQLEFVAINDLGNIVNLAYLLKYDTVYGRYGKPVTVEDGNLAVDGSKIKFISEKEPTKLPWKDLGIDIVIESTGAFESFEKAAVHLQAGAKRAVISAPAKDLDGQLGQTVLSGINEEALKICSISSNGSCTTNASSPVIQIMSENPGIQKAMLSTVHANTNLQSVVDSPVNNGDMRRGRAAGQNIIPFATGAAISVTRAIKSLAGKFDGLAYRVPVIVGSIADITFLAKRKVTVEEINDIFRAAAKEQRWQNILKVVEEPVVSTDIIGEPYGAIVDLSFTKVVDHDLVKVLSWYDNEWGYSATLLRHVLSLAPFVR